MGIAKRERHRRSAPLRVLPDGPLEGHEFTMRRMSARFWIALNRATHTTADMVEETLDAILDSSLPDDDATLDVDEVDALVSAWIRAMREDAVPPPSGTS